MDATDAASIPTDVLADLEAVCRQAAAGEVRDPQLVRRVQERAAKARQDILDRHGVQDVGVAIIREARDAR
jgi:hypothetical protein